MRAHGFEFGRGRGNEDEDEDDERKRRQKMKDERWWRFITFGIWISNRRAGGNLGTVQ